MFFEQAREQSEKEYNDNPEDAHVSSVVWIQRLLPVLNNGFANITSGNA